MGCLSAIKFGMYTRVVQNDIFFSYDLSTLGIGNHTQNIHSDFFSEFFEVIFLCANELEKIISSNIMKIWSCSNIHDLYTNRCRFSRWFQKCITLWVYLQYFLRYSQLTAKFRRFWARGPKFRQFWQKNTNISLNIEDRPIKLYIFEISVKIRIDWYTNRGNLSNFNFS